MFYNKEQFDSHLNCKNCNKRFDLPRLLTCGEVICETCLNNIKNVCDTTNEIKCTFCKNVHAVPKNGFPIQKILFNLLKLQPLEKFRGVLVEELDEATKELNRRSGVIKSFHESSQKKIRERTTELRKKIADSTEKKRDELQNIENKLNSKMDAYEKDANEQIKLVLDKFLQENEPNFKTWNNLLENATIENESSLLTGINEITGLMRKITIQEQSIKKLIDNIEIIYFDESKAKINESLIGVLKNNKNEANEEEENNEQINDEKLNASTNQSTEPNGGFDCKTQ